DRAELQAVQRPLKEQYREEPTAALITLRADGKLDEDHIACKVETGRALVEAGLHPATGGSGALACSGDMLLEALVACPGVTLRWVWTWMELEVTGSVHAEATSTSGARSASIAKRRSDSPRSGSASTSPPTLRRRSSTSCSSAQSATASSGRHSPPASR